MPTDRDLALQACALRRRMLRLIHDAGAEQQVLRVSVNRLNTDG